jgi:hypothetical protein
VNADQEGNGCAGNDPAPRRVAIVRLGGYNVRRCTLVSCQPVRARRQKRQDGHRNYVPVDLLNSPAGRAHEPGKEAHGLGSLEEQVMLGSCGPGRGLYGVNVRRELAAVNGREITVGSVYAPRERLATGCGQASNCSRAFNV